MSVSEREQRRHIPYLSFHKTIIREICRPQKDDLLIIAKGLGMRRVSQEPQMDMLMARKTYGGSLTPDHLCAPQDV